VKICRAVKHPSGGARSSPIDKSMRVTLHAGMTLATVNLSTFMRSKILCDSCSIFCLAVFRSKAKISSSPENYRRAAVAQWLRCCATNRKVAGSILAGVSGFFIAIKSFRSHYSPGVDSASNRNEYQEYFLGIKAAGA